jgi:hypothetical protein
MILYGQLADSIGAAVCHSLGPRAPHAHTPTLTRHVDVFPSDRYRPMQNRCRVDRDHDPRRSFGRVAYLELTGNGQLWAVAETDARLDPERHWYLSPQLRYRTYPDPFPRDLRLEAVSVVSDPATVGLQPVRQLTQTLGAIPTGVAHRLPAFDRGLLERAAQARHDQGDSNALPIHGMRQPDSEQRTRERDLSERPTGGLRRGPPGQVLSVR